MRVASPSGWSALTRVPVGPLVRAGAPRQHVRVAQHALGQRGRGRLHDDDVTQPGHPLAHGERGGQVLLVLHHEERASQCSTMYWTCSGLLVV